MRTASEVLRSLEVRLAALEGGRKVASRNIHKVKAPVLVNFEGMNDLNLIVASWDATTIERTIMKAGYKTETSNAGSMKEIYVSCGSDSDCLQKIAQMLPQFNFIVNS